MFKYKVLLYRYDMQPLTVRGFDCYNEAVYWGKSQLEMENKVKPHGYVIFNKDNQIEFFESF